MLVSGQLDADKNQRGAKIIEASAKTQAQLINDLLDISRIVSGKIALENSRVDPQTVIQNAIEAVRPLAQAKSIEIDTFFASQVGHVWADPVRLLQVIWNLLSNAIKFSAANSKISVRLGKVEAVSGQKAQAVIQVSDSGKGISAAFLPMLFERFSQADASSIRLHGGLGLGLAIVRNLVELQGGSVMAESPGDGLGATFTVRLPIHSELLALANLALPILPVEVPNSTPIRLDGVHALIVDDELNTREALGEVLRSYGAKTVLAATALEGFVQFRAAPPQILICDIAMPGEDGYSLIQRIRALPPSAGGTIPALAITAYAGGDDIRSALASGFQAHFSKPVDGLDLARAIRKLTLPKNKTEV